MKSYSSYKKFTPNKKVRLLGLLFTFIFVMGNILLSPALPVNADTSEQRVYDNAGLLTPEEITSLESTALEIGAEYNTAIYILTDVDSDGKSRKRYMEDFADSKEVVNSTLIFVNMDPSNRGVEIQGYRDDENTINGSRIEYILDEVVPYLQGEDYYLAFTTFLDQVNYYLGKDPSEDTSTHTPNTNYADSDKYYQEEQSSEDSILSQLWFQVIISLVVGGITVGIMAANSGGRVTVNESTYLDSNHSRLLSHHDNYIRTTTTRIKKPENNSSGGGGGGGISSGGRSHSGGGRSF